MTRSPFFWTCLFFFPLLKNIFLPDLGIRKKAADVTLIQIMSKICAAVNRLDGYVVRPVTNKKGIYDSRFSYIGIYWDKIWSFFKINGFWMDFSYIQTVLLNQISLFSLSIVECQFAGQLCSHLIDNFVIQLYLYFNICVILYINNNFHCMFNIWFS